MEVSDILNSSKNNKHGELIVILFEYCNLSCLMCSQNHSDKTGMFQIRDKIEYVKKSIDGIRAKGKTSVIINIMGGELFADQLPDSIFDDYSFLIESVREYAQEINFPTEIQISTNLVYDKVNRVKEFLDKTNIKISVSYDSTGRFNIDDFSKFKCNIENFKTYINQIGSVMTLPTMKKLMSNNDTYFKYLYDNFSIVFDHYSPEVFGYKTIENTFNGQLTVDKLNPKDVDLRDFYKFMFDNWPKCYPFSDLVKKGNNMMSCMSTVTVTPNSSITSCEKYEIDNEVKPIKIMFSNLNKMKDKWLDDYDCFSCVHYQRCTMGCFAVHLKSSRTQEVCWLKEVYDYIDEKN